MFVTALLLFLCFCSCFFGMWVLSSPTRDQTHTPCIERQSLNHWMAKEVPSGWALKENVERKLFKMKKKNHPLPLYGLLKKNMS